MTSSLTKFKSIFEKDKGASLSNEFEVDIRFSSSKNAEVIANLAKNGFSSFTNTESAYKNMMLLCDEASIPGQYAATQEIDGLYTGRLIQYPHGKLYNDFSLSFIMTNEELPLKFFETWFYSIFPERRLNEDRKIDYGNKIDRGERTNIVTLSYYDNITCDLLEVRKFHKTQFAANGQVTSTHKMYRAYPYSIESIPLAYGPSVLNKFRVQFRYEKHVQEYS